MKKTLFYEDIQEVPYDEIQDYLTWLINLNKKQKNYYQRDRDFQEEDTCNGYLPILLQVLKFSGCYTIEELATELEKFGYEMTHKKNGQKTEQLYAKAVKTVNKLEKSMYFGKIMYYFIDLRFVVGYRNLKKRKNLLEQQIPDLPGTTEKSLPLFYEDIEELSFREVQELREWYTYLAEKESASYWAIRDEVEENYTSGNVTEQAVVQCTSFFEEATTFKELEESLTKVGYELMHKSAEQRTEQLASRLIKSCNNTGEIRYYFLDLNYEPKFTRLLRKQA